VKHKSSAARDITPQTVVSSGAADTDEDVAFINFIGGSGSGDGANITTSDVTGYVDFGGIRINVNGVPKYLATYTLP